MNNLFGEPVKETAGMPLCRCGCGMPVEYRGYGRPRKYVSRSHAAAARREQQKYEIMVLRDASLVSRQRVQVVSDYMRESGYLTPELEYVMGVLTAAPFPVETFAQAFHDTIALCITE